jgi:putative oxidoreductase
MNVTIPRHLPLSLLLIRASIVLMLAPWVVDKFRNPEHAIGVFERFYGLGGVAEVLVYGIGIAQVVLLLCFALGLFRTVSYGLVMLMHAGSTLSSWRQYLDPFTGANLLFFAAWPMLAACIALFLLREHDTLLSVGKSRR